MPNAGSPLSRGQLIASAQGTYQQRLRMARDRLDIFIEMCARDQDGKQIRLAPIHRAWVWHVAYCWDRGLRAIILAPFGSGKSTTFAVPLAAWLLGKNQQARLQVISNGDEYAKQRVASAKQILESPTFKDIFPHIRKGVKWGEHTLFVKREGHDPNPSLAAHGVATMGVGTRSEATIFDDVCDELNVSNEDRRKKIKGFVSNTWMSRLDPIEGRVLWIATPWHVDDATAEQINHPLSCTLIQRVGEDFKHYDQEVVNAGADYTMPPQEDPQPGA